MSNESERLEQVIDAEYARVNPDGTEQTFKPRRKHFQGLSKIVGTAASKLSDFLVGTTKYVTEHTDKQHREAFVHDHPKIMSAVKVAGVLGGAHLIEDAALDTAIDFAVDRYLGGFGLLKDVSDFATSAALASIVWHYSDEKHSKAHRGIQAKGKGIGLGTSELNHKLVDGVFKSYAITYGAFAGMELVGELSSRVPMFRGAVEKIAGQEGQTLFSYMDNPWITSAAAIGISAAWGFAQSTDAAPHIKHWLIDKPLWHWRKIATLGASYTSYAMASGNVEDWIAMSIGTTVGAAGSLLSKTRRGSMGSLASYYVAGTALIAGHGPDALGDGGQRLATAGGLYALALALPAFAIHKARGHILPYQ